MSRADSICGESLGNNNSETDGKTRKIRASIVIEDSLWEDMSTFHGEDDPTQEIVNQLETLFKGVNKHLVRLDNGGFMVDFDHNVTNFGKSGIRLKNTYIDRTDKNILKKFDKSDIFAHTFTFQEAVEVLPNRYDVDLRILIIPERTLIGNLQPRGTAEETCICNPDWFGCIAVFSIVLKNNWSFHQTVFAHEIGHTLGMDVHDDQFYNEDIKDKLLMWSSVSREAFVWSEEARRRINNQDNSCLCRV